MPVPSLSATISPSFPSLLRVLCLGLPLLFAGCATTGPGPDGSATPKIARLTPEELARLTPSTPKLALDGLLAMARAGQKPEALISRLRESDARFDLKPSEVLDWHKRGLPLEVLEAIHEDREKALRADLAQLLAERDQKCSAELTQERQRARMAPDPFWPGACSPFGPRIYRRGGGLFYGW